MKFLRRMPRKCFGSDVTPAIRSDGAFSADGAFLPLPSLDPLAVLQVFRRMLLLRLHKAERLTESFMHNLLSWVHPGFSVYAGSPVDAAEVASLQSQARYITRPAVAMDALQKLDDGNLVMDTPPDPRTGATSITLDPLEWIHRLTSHIPDPGRHCQRFYGAYANRARISVSSTDGQSAASPAAHHPQQDDSDFSREARSTWARLSKKSSRRIPSCAAAGRACASSPLLQIPAWSTVSCAIWKAGAAGLRILSNRGLRPLPQQRFGNEAANTADARLRTGRLFGRGVDERRQNPNRQARNSGLAGI